MKRGLPSSSAVLQLCHVPPLSRGSIAKTALDRATIALLRIKAFLSCHPLSGGNNPRMHHEALFGSCVWACLHRNLSKPVAGTTAVVPVDIAARCAIRSIPLAPPLTMQVPAFACFDANDLAALLPVLEGFLEPTTARRGWRTALWLPAMKTRGGADRPRQLCRSPGYLWSSSKTIAISCLARLSISL